MGEQAALLRPGVIAQEDIEAVLGSSLAAPKGGVEAPGMLASHYAPRARLRLGAVALASDEAGLDFCGRFGACGQPMLDLSKSGDLTEAAANLYAHLRQLDATGCERIAVAPIPDVGLGAAMNDRLNRAAAPRGERCNPLGKCVFNGRKVSRFRGFKKKTRQKQRGSRGLVDLI